MNKNNKLLQGNDELENHIHLPQSYHICFSFYEKRCTVDKVLTSNDHVHLEELFFKPHSLLTLGRGLHVCFFVFVLHKLGDSRLKLRSTLPPDSLYLVERIFISYLIKPFYNNFIGLLILIQYRIVFHSPCLEIYVL